MRRSHTHRSDAVDPEGMVMSGRIMSLCRRAALAAAVSGAMLFQTTGCTIDDTLSSRVSTYGISAILSMLTSSTTSGRSLERGAGGEPDGGAGLSPHLALSEAWLFPGVLMPCAVVVPTAGVRVSERAPIRYSRPRPHAALSMTRRASLRSARLISGSTTGQ